MKECSIIISIFLSVSVLFAGEESEKPITRDHSSIKKEQVKEYRAGAEDEEKDRVNEWFSEDIDYYNRLIKLKSDYRRWALERIDENGEVVFDEYVEGKKFTRKEKQILYDYHLRLIGERKPAGTVKKRVKKSLPAGDALPIKHGQDRPDKNSVPGHGSGSDKNEESSGMAIPASAGAVLALVILMAIMVLRKLRVKAGA